MARDKFENQITLGSKGIVGTIMTNKGLEISLAKMGVDLIRTDVGDRHVLQKLEELNWDLGGEQSGHIISCLLYTSPSPRDTRESRIPSSA